MINFRNIDDSECLKWCLVRYLYYADVFVNLPSTKPDNNFAKKLDFKDVKNPVKVRDIQKIEKRNSIGISVFDYENKEKHPIYVSIKYFEEKCLLIYY